MPANVFVTANYKVNKIGLMRPGQPAEVEIDALHGQSFHGHINSIQAGSGAAFSLLPPENATGNYVKVVERVPVKIVFDHLPQVGLRAGRYRITFSVSTSNKETFSRSNWTVSCSPKWNRSSP